MTAAKNPTRLFWSERGSINCIEHAPYRGSDHWVWERWRKMTPAEIEAFTQEVGRAPRCESCSVEPDGANRGE